MKMNKIVILGMIMIITFALIAASCPTARDNELWEPPHFPGLGVGINIGNTLDAIGTHTWLAGETGWGNPMITRDFVKALSMHGYKTIRLPVTWAENIGPAPTYTITPERMARVEEVVGWILEEGMYCILNLHHDGGHSDKSWILGIANNEAEVQRQFELVWRQIAERFRDSSDKLILESMNEVGFDNLWNRWGPPNPTGKAEAYRLVNLLNQSFVNTVRATGGGNTARHLLIAGYWTDIEQTCDPLFQMPQDTIQERLMLSVHYYTPATFAIADDPNNSWGYRRDWGTDADYAELNRLFQMLKVNFIDKGIPIILGEYGATKRNKEEASRIRWMTAVTQISLDMGICPVLWDTGINPAANNNSGEIERNAPYAMTDTLKQVWMALR